MATVLVTALVMLFGALPAHATPASDKRAEASRVKSQIDELDRKVEIASEAYNEAYSKHAALVSDIQETQAHLDATNARIGELQGMLSIRANSMYRSGPLSFVEVLFGSASFEEFSATWEVLTDINESEAASVSELKGARADAERTRDELGAKEAEAQTVLNQMASNKSSIESQLSSRKSMLSGLESEIAAIEAAEAARQAAAASSVSRSSRSSASSSRRFPPPTRAARSEVVSIAKKYLGAPYKWAAVGPNSFDCSGFTMFVYRQVGVSLPHSSRAQYGSGQRVSRSDLQPGDLVFFGSPIHHVGIYVGGNSYIHSPRTGDVVKISSLTRRDYVGACRP